MKITKQSVRRMMKLVDDFATYGIGIYLHMKIEEQGTMDRIARELNFQHDNEYPTAWKYYPRGSAFGLIIFDCNTKRVLINVGEEEE